MGAAGCRALPLAALALAACTSIAADQRTFDGTRWNVVAINGQATPGGDRFSIVFGPVSFTGRMGCNLLRGDYHVVGGQLIPGMSMATQMGCLSDAPRAIPPMTFEEWAFRVLRKPMRLDWASGKQLTLINDAGAIALERVP